jgi:hypothetical protein
MQASRQAGRQKQEARVCVNKRDTYRLGWLLQKMSVAVWKKKIILRAIRKK